jgi:integrase
MQRDSTLPAPTGKPSKPFDEFPLFPHATKRWAKKIRGKLHYFGPWDKPDEALAKYNREKDDLHAGRTPKEQTGELTIKELVNHFRQAKECKVTSGELSPRTLAEYKAAISLIQSQFSGGRLVSDVQPADFTKLRQKMAQKWGPYRLGNTIQCIRCIFRFGFESGLMDKPMRFGPEFKRPTRKTVRLHRAKDGAKLFAAEEVRAMIEAAGTQMKAMILLGINCGFGNSDVGNLPITSINLDIGIIDYPRPKTGIARRCPLWQETVAALRDVLAARKEPKNAEDGGLLFVTKRGLSWAKDTPGGPVSQETRKLLKSLNINGHRNFYTLRHTFRTIADESKDQPACDYIMGHEVPHMSSIYRERISDERLKAVADHVHDWLFPLAKQEKPKRTRKPRAAKAQAAEAPPAEDQAGQEAPSATDAE